MIQLSLFVLFSVYCRFFFSKKLLFRLSYVETLCVLCLSYYNVAIFYLSVLKFFVPWKFENVLADK